MTLPGRRPAQGRRHPFELVLGELKEIFLGMGFDVVSGPEVELDHYLSLIHISFLTRRKGYHTAQARTRRNIVKYAGFEVSFLCRLLCCA